MRLKDADELIRAVHDEWDECLVWDESGATTADEMERIINDAPTIDPVKHGKWTKHILNNANVPWGYDCSACDGWFVVGEDAIKKYHFCPNCGAKMNKELG